MTRLGLPATAERIALLARTDAELWCEIRPSALALVHRVRAAGLVTAILSNAPARLGLELLTVPWRDAVDHWFVSAELGLTKPDPAIYHLVTDTLALPPQQIAFIDDRPPNVEAALALGWSAHLWVDDADTAAWLDALLPSGPERFFDGGVGFLDRALSTADDHG
ncbi:MAG: HAD-IA family hydrolase [Micropruina sp.]|nr:HAD-IA family hydrolase [Micropruina sp.]